MSRLLRAGELIGMPIVSLDSAATLGEVKDVLVDPARSRVIGVTVRGHGLLSSPLIGILPAESVHAIGRDALMIASETALVREREGMDGALADQQEVVGKEVVTRSGTSLGTVGDVVLEVEGPTAVVVGYQIGRSDGHTLIVPVPEGVPLSGDALVVPDEVEQQTAANGLAGFREVLDRARMTHSGAGA
ncbi:MAG TPA: PRC-barrel domain-containing protein [Candidatus Limnocylindria bacterium]|nr:PRC-barrel domain-containing protein [Candidatus Limnocylindria bacterium]